MNRPTRITFVLLGIAASVGLGSLIAGHLPCDVLPISECHKTIARGTPLLLKIEPIVIEIPNYQNYWSNHPDCGTDEKALQEQYEKALRNSKKAKKGNKGTP